jgi:3-phosphoshikimate 1-carboxyvinyltransferase
VSRPVQRLRILPVGSLRGVLDPPGDKSITHRAVILGALAEGVTIVENPNPGADCDATLACLGLLGIECSAAAGSLTVRGAAMRWVEPDRVLDCGNSGTTLRLLSGALAAQPFLSILAGDESLQRRPVDRVIEPLRRMGAELHARDGDRRPPLVIRGGALRGIGYRAAVPSAQVATCVLLAGLAAAGETTVELPGPARDHTERLLPAFGIEPRIEPLAGAGRRVALTGPALPSAARVRVPGDFSSAAFFLAAAASLPGSEVEARGVSLNPTRTGLLEVLAAMGAQVTIEAERVTSGGEPLGDVTVRGPDHLEAFDVPPAWIPRMVDEVPAWAIAAAAARGVSRIRGAAELRLKESDRLAALAGGLAGLGLAAREEADGLAVTGGVPTGGTVTSHGDHRIAMALALLATRARAPVVIEDTASIATSYPAFVTALGRLGGAASEEAGRAETAARIAG